MPKVQLSPHLVIQQLPLLVVHRPLHLMVQLEGRPVVQRPCHQLVQHVLRRLAQKHLHLVALPDLLVRQLLRRRVV